ncbi:protein TASOR-like [Trichomycterus rosablanca]|uniref:protein TASOR-like n=1 Tax=Trichomycterus rosablanca TaxID=2290929 RepID=UPI002F35B5CE
MVTDQAKEVQVQIAIKIFECVLEPVLPGSVTFDRSILAPLRNNYLYEESKECFTYNSACLVTNAALQKRYSDFRAEKQAKGYSEEELEESFGFLLFNDISRANRLADTGLIVGQGTCTTLGDCSKGVYISKYSDCLDLKRWYDGKKGYIVLFKLTKGRVKEVTENYTQNFTPPTAGYDCHVSEQLRAVCATTSSFLAFERTQYYMYELLDGRKVEQCPRHVLPFAIVCFSYGKTCTLLKEKSQENTSFHYQPWRGQLKIGSIVYNIGLRSIHGAMFPANLPKTVQVHHVIGVSELRKTLPQAVFETSLLGEVFLDSRWFSLYDVISYETKNDLALLTQELKRKDLRPKVITTGI